MPACSAGLFSVTPATSAPVRVGHGQAFGDLVGHLLDADAEPAAAGLAELAQLGDDVDRRLDGIAKPMPIEPPVGEMIAVLMPTTSPSMLNSGPPELPRLMAASVWMKLS